MLMTHSLSPELRWLTYTILMTALFWVPYILDRLAKRGLWPTVTDTKAETGETPTLWAKRAICAHTNAVENLMIFAPAVLIASAVGVSTPATQSAAAVYFFARLVHFIVYTLGVPVFRTLSFAVGWAAQIVIIVSILLAAWSGFRSF
jgi:uncharacterized MAPEG superfamily protein